MEKTPSEPKGKARSRKKRMAEEDGVHHVPLGFAHLAAVQKEPAVAVHPLGQGEVQGHEHGGPDDGVEPHNLLAHKVDVGGPVFLEVVVPPVAVPQGGDVVTEGVHPDIDHVLGVKLHRHPPGEAGAGDAKVLQPLADEGLHLVDAGLGGEKLRVLVVEGQDFTGVLGEAEEVGLLLGVHHRAAAVGALAVHQLAFGPEGFAGGAVFALVGPLVDIPLVIEGLENLLHRFHMVIVGGADKAVVGDVEELPEGLEAGDDFVHILLGAHPGGLGLFLNLLAVLVRPGEEQNVVPGEAFIAGHGIGGHGAIAMADVQVIRGVIDGGGDVKFFLFHWGARLLCFGLAPPLAGPQYL